MEIALAMITLILLLVVYSKTRIFQDFKKKHLVDDFPEGQPERCMVCNKPYCRECESCYDPTSAHEAMDRLRKK